jgi:hypothetical protein
MSEYQYYEFLAIDRPLSAEDMAYVRTLSSRVQPTPTHAAFTYSYGDFRGDPLALLAKHYDALLYLANWGSKQLAFRFPKAAIDEQALKPYYYGVEEIELTTVGQHIILNIDFQDEGMDWVEGEGQLASLAPLRDDILRGDLRALYLAWLASAARGTAAEGDDDLDDEEEWDDAEERDQVDGDELIEPPVPPGLGQLSAPLRAFMEFFDIDQDLVGAAAAASPALKATTEPIERWVPLLPEVERNSFLVRAARGEPIGAELLRRLREVGGAARPAAATAPRRSFSAIVEAAEEVRRERKERERQAAERARLAKLEALAKREGQVWAQVPELLSRRTASGYEEAVAHLVELRDLAVYQGKRAAFDARLEDILAPYATSAALLRRLREKKLVK